MESQFPILSYGGVVFFAIEFAASLVFSTEPEASLFPILAILVALPAAILVPRTGYKILKYLFHDRQMRREPNLRKSEEVIQQRLQEIKKRTEQIEAVRSRIKSDTEQWQSVRGTLDEVLATLRNHYTRYSTKLIEIELARWQNKLRPLLTKLETLTYEQAEARLRRLEEVIKSGEAMKAKLKEQLSAIDSTSEAQNIYDRVEETLVSCQRIHEALVGHQAVLALKGVGMLPDTLSATSVPADELWKLEVFNIQVSITDFSSSFEELEAEYTRIQAEDQIRDILEKAANI